ncbi:ATP-binding protein [Micromonospora sp. M12]
MFGHVGRRTQNLVGRQIALIDRLEEQEADPGRLEHLYRLDHISSRLRRNAGSLVVLSGSAGADAHTAPVPLADVVRLALGEIEDYTRVEVQVPAGVSAAPAVVADLILALAELMENATVFSPPHTRVLVAAETSGVGARITVVDHGIGMSEQRLAEENARFTRRERLDLAPTEVLGLFVVGRLARRHGWDVSLTATGGGGVTAQLEIPPRPWCCVVPTAPGPPWPGSRCRDGTGAAAPSTPSTPHSPSRRPSPHRPVSTRTCSAGPPAAWMPARPGTRSARTRRSRPPPKNRRVRSRPTSRPARGSGSGCPGQPARHGRADPAGGRHRRGPAAARALVEAFQAGYAGPRRAGQWASRARRRGPPPTRRLVSDRRWRT